MLQEIFTTIITLINPNSFEITKQLLYLQCYVEDSDYKLFALIFCSVPTRIEFWELFYFMSVALIFEDESNEGQKLKVFYTLMIIDVG